MGSEMEVKAFKGCKIIPRTVTSMTTDKKKSFPVIVQVTAPSQPQSSAEDMRLAGVDIVALLDTSDSMRFEKRLKHMKEAMKSVISLLGDDDRLAIVSFKKNVETIMDLTDMRGAGSRQTAMAKIDNELILGKGNNMPEALQTGVKILGGRDSQDRLGCMIFLSDGGNYSDICDTEISDKYSVYTFGFGASHNPRVMEYIANCTRGTYSFVNDVAKIKDAFEFFIKHHLKPVAARSIEITLKACASVAISKVRCGGYHDKKKKLKLEKNCSDVKIEIQDIYAGETKSIAVYLTVVEKEMSEKLLTVSGSYKTTLSAKEERRELELTEVCVLRPESCSPEQLVMESQVAARLTWIKLEDGVERILDKLDSGDDDDDVNNTKATCSQELEELLVKIKGKQYYCSSVAAEIESTVDEMKKDIDGDDNTKSSGMRYMRSWLTCCRWQRATWAAESGCIRPALVVDHEEPEPDCIIQPAVVVDHEEPEPEPDCIIQPAVQVDDSGNSAGKGTGLTSWWKKFIVSKPWLLCGELLLAVALLSFFSRRTLQGSSWWSSSSTTTTITTTAGGGTSTTVPVIPAHADWDSMEEQLVELVQSRKKAEESKIGSLFHQAASSDLDMDLQIQRYLYMTIVYATVLRSHRLGALAISDKEVKREVSKYLQHMPKAMEGIEIPSFDFERTTVVDMKKGMDRYLYSTIVQSSVVQASYWEQTPTTEPGFFMISKIWNSITTTISRTWSIVVTRRKEEQSVSVSVSELQKQLEEKAEQLKQKTELVLLIQQQLQEKEELVVRIETELRKKETLVVTLREEVTTTRAELSTCSLSVEKVKSQLTACRRKGRWLEGKISELEDPQAGAHAVGLDDQHWEAQEN